MGIWKRLSVNRPSNHRVVLFARIFPPPLPRLSPLRPPFSSRQRLRSSILPRDPALLGGSTVLHSCDFICICAYARVHVCVHVCMRRYIYIRPVLLRMHANPEARKYERTRRARARAEAADVARRTRTYALIDVSLI